MMEVIPPENTLTLSTGAGSRTVPELNNFSVLSPEFVSTALTLVFPVISSDTFKGDSAASTDLVTMAHPSATGAAANREKISMAGNETRMIELKKKTEELRARGEWWEETSIEVATEPDRRAEYVSSRLGWAHHDEVGGNILEPARGQSWDILRNAIYFRIKDETFPGLGFPAPSNTRLGQRGSLISLQHGSSRGLASECDRPRA